MNPWTQAEKLAEQTPEQRNRYVDFLRAISILVVIIGHWLIATAYYVDGELTLSHLLEAESKIMWLTWVFQVMPIFFIVGGYANAVSLQSSARKGVGYAGWLIARLHRLISPLLLVVVVWAIASVALQLLGVSADKVQMMSRAALIPTWFLAIYIMLILLAPLAYAMWKKWGFGSFVLLAGLAITTDLLFFLADLKALGWSNYFWVWLAVHQLGFAWRDNRLGSALLRLFVAVSAFALLYSLVAYGPYPLAMVGSPDEDVSNVLPPKVTLLILGLMQAGLLLAMEAPMRKLLGNLKVWTGTVLINSMIMTIYLWHMTLMIIIVASLNFSGGFGLGLEPNTAAWWWARPIWVAVLLVLLLPFALLLSPLERAARRAEAKTPAAWRQVIGATMVAFSVALIAMHGYRGGEFLVYDILTISALVTGAIISGVYTVGTLTNKVRKKIDKQ